MSISSKISVLYLLVVLFSIKQSVCTSSSEADKPPNLCKAKDQPGFNLTLRASMLFKKALILIDHNWFVYEVPYSSMNNSYSQLLIDIYAKPIEEYWPAFKTHKPWPDIKPNVVTIYHVDLKVPILYMVASGAAGGICYNMDTSEFLDGTQTYGELIERRITDTGLTQFSIKMNGSHVLLLNWKITWYDDGRQSDSNSSYMGYMYYTTKRTNPDLKNISVINQHMDPSKVIPTGFEWTDLDWNMPPGFVFQGHFHFFDHKNVFTFPISPLVWKKYPKDDPMPLHATNPVAITPVKDYFKCVHLKLSSNTYPPDQNSLDPGKSSYWIWIVVAIVMLLLIAAIALLVWYFMLGSKGKDSKSRKHSSGNTVRTRASSKKDNNFASKQRSSKQGNSKRKPSTQGSSKQGTSYASKQKPSSHKKK